MYCYEYTGLRSLESGTRGQGQLQNLMQARADQYVSGRMSAPDILKQSGSSPISSIRRELQRIAPCFSKQV